jgi:hypothetical protein
MAVVTRRTERSGPPPARAARATTRPRIALAYWLSGAIAGLLVVAAAGGLFAPGLYRDPPAIRAMNQGSDLITLLVVVPALVAAMVRAARGSLRAQIVWMGLLGYVAYYYVLFAYGVRFNPLFLVYVALMGLALFALGILLARCDVAGLPARFAPGLPVRLIGGYLVGLAALFALIWLADIVPALFGPPPLPKPNGALGPGNPVEVNDLAVVLPLMIVAGVQLWRRAAAGYLLAGVMLMLSIAVAVVLLPSPLFQYLDGQAIDWGQYPVGLVMTLAGLALLTVYLRALREPGPAAGPPQEG